MDSFILLTFAFLGWAFYELSGGADFEPRHLRMSGPRQAGDLRPSAPGRSERADAPHRRASVGADDAGARQPEQRRAQPDLWTCRAVPPQPHAHVTRASARASGESRVIASRLRTTSPTGSVVTARQQDLRVVAGNRVNMRAGPGTDYDVIAKLNAATQVEVLRDPGNGWVKLRPDGDTGLDGWRDLSRPKLIANPPPRQPPTKRAGMTRNPS